MTNRNAALPTDYGFSHPLFWPGACAHCRGGLQLCEDGLGKYRKCVNCSRTAPEGLGPITVPAAQPALRRWNARPLPAAA